MTKIRAIKRKQLIKNLRQHGFDGPYSGGKHSFMKRAALTIRIPSYTEIVPELLRKILKQAEILEKDWIN